MIVILNLFNFCKEIEFGVWLIFVLNMEIIVSDCYFSVIKLVKYVVCSYCLCFCLILMKFIYILIIVYIIKFRIMNNILLIVIYYKVYLKLGKCCINKILCICMLYRYEF